MAKRFFETFPALILEDELKDLFEFAEVTALKYNRDRTAIHVYLLCRRLISKPQIYAVESKIEKQMFPDGDMKIRIFESFSLSEQYTPSYLVDVYKDSLFAGPGEAKEADLGIAGGVGCGVIIKKGEIIRKLPEEELLAGLKEELDNWQA